jgi:signal transduction histidine kinase
MAALQFSFNPYPFVSVVVMIFGLVVFSYLIMYRPKSRVTWSLIGFSGCTVLVYSMVLLAQMVQEKSFVVMLWTNVFTVIGVFFSVRFAFAFPNNGVMPQSLALGLTSMILLSASYAFYGTISVILYSADTLPLYLLMRLIAPSSLLLLLGVFLLRSFSFSAIRPHPSIDSLRAMVIGLIWPANKDALAHRNLALATTIQVLVGFAPFLWYMNRAEAALLVGWMAVISLLASGFLVWIFLSQIPSSFIMRLVGISLITLLSILTFLGVEEIRRTYDGIASLPKLRTAIRQDRAVDPSTTAIPATIAYILEWSQTRDGALDPAAAQLLFKHDDHLDLRFSELVALDFPLPPADRTPSSLLLLQTPTPQPPQIWTYQNLGHADPPLYLHSREFFAANGYWYEIGYVTDQTGPIANQLIGRLNRQVALSALSILLFFPLLFRFNLVDPLNHLLEGVRRANRGELDIQIQPRFEDEIGYLICSFNEMICSIRASQQKLREINANLETLVIERTAALQEAMQHAQAANRAKSAFLATISHELRTPLTTILGYSELMTQDRNLPAHLQDQLATINRSGEHLLALINNILDLSKVEANRMESQTEAFDLVEMVTTLEEIFRLQAERKGIGLGFVIAPDVPPVIRADAKMLRQILLNLMSNAVKFTPSGEVNLYISVKKKTTDDCNDTVCTPMCFVVEDTGIGIAESELKMIFDAFVQVNDRSIYREGTGLGLAISQQLVRLMGGEITVESKVGHGSRFAFTIPVGVVDRLPNAAIVTTQPSVLSAGQPQYRLLVAEDNDDNRILLVQILQRMGFDVRAARNGHECLELWQTWRPDLICMDVHMPLMDGQATLQAIRRQPGSEETIIIALTASVAEEAREALLAIGWNDLLHKPFRQADLIRMLSQHLALSFETAADLQPTPAQSMPLFERTTTPILTHARPMTSHRLLNLLTGIIGYTEVLMTDRDQLPSEMIDLFLHNIDQNAQQLATALKQ